MRLDPVYVVAPRAASPSMPTRRAFLLASGTFAVGATLGGACGYAVGAHAAPAPEPEPSAAPPPAKPADDEPLKPSGDVDLDEMRRLAVKAPIEELVAIRLAFVNTMFDTYPKDEVLWRGVKRLCEFVLAGRPVDNKQHFARALAGVIEQGDAALTRDLKKFVPELKRVK